MSPLAKYYIGAGIGSLLAIWLLPGLISFLVVVGLLGAPVVAWFMLDESQRRRILRLRRRGIGR